MHPRHIERDRLPFVSGSVGIVIANQALKHIQELFWIAHEVSRVLRVGGSNFYPFPPVLARAFPTLAWGIFARLVKRIALRAAVPGLPGRPSSRDPVPPRRLTVRCHATDPVPPVGLSPGPVGASG